MRINSSISPRPEDGGGKRTLSSRIRYAYANPGNIDQKTTYTISLEEVEATSLGTSANDPIQEAGNTNNISILHTGLYDNGEPYASDLLLELEHSQPALDSDFRYTTLFANFGQQLDFHVNHAFRIELIRGLTDGIAPLQKQHLWGTRWCCAASHARSAWCTKTLPPCGWSTST